MANGIVINEKVIVAQLRNNDDFKIRTEDDITIIEESDDSISIEIVRVLKYICKNFANYILVDNQFIIFIRNELRRSRIQAGINSFASDLDEIAPYFEENPELTVFSVLDGEDMHE